MEVTGSRDPWEQMDEIRPGLREFKCDEHGRDILTRILTGGVMQVGDTIRSQ